MTGSKERARAWLDRQSNEPGIHLGEMESSLAALLDAAIREARLSEAKWWQAATNCTQSEAREMNRRIEKLEKS